MSLNKTENLKTLKLQGRARAQLICGRALAQLIDGRAGTQLTH